jgi:hypothetical protein
MILTLEILAATGACQEGYDVGVQLGGLINMDIEESAAILESNGYVQYANWVRNLINNPLALKLSGGYSSVFYCVYNPVDNIYLRTYDETLIETIKQTIMGLHPGVDQSLITTQIVATNTLSNQLCCAQLDAPVLQLLMTGVMPTTTATTTSTGYIGSVG